MENTGFYVIPNKTQYEIGERVWLEIKKTGPTKANHVKVSLFTYQGENLKMECTLEQGAYIPLAESISEKTGGYLVGKVLKTIERPNGLKIDKVSVPMGVIAIIYESRPNVTSDAAALCIKSGNVWSHWGGSRR